MDEEDIADTTESSLEEAVNAEGWTLRGSGTQVRQLYKCQRAAPSQVSKAEMSSSDRSSIPEKSPYITVHFCAGYIR